MNLTTAEENYLKAIYHLSDGGKKSVSTNDVAGEMNTKPASVSDMLRKLGEKEVIEYRKYYGVNITDEGKKRALQTIRKHRLWEVFLVEKLNFAWDEVHEVAEELEHIQSPLLIQRLDAFLNYPKFDPHGDPIPDEFGDVRARPRIPLNEMELNQSGQIVAVKDSSAAFLRYLDKVGAYIGARIKVLDKVEFDGSLEILVDQKKNIFMSKDVAGNILVLQS
ncbi:MAG TPA: metal-dependent transcriptional regulator [Algoriphagus sp.]|jgi:DtxR family Mn-dependent transcriptional regulator|uniref:Transcriptional regulator MntR n=1 Tax=Algoriphagus ornithinivorans TaxID=226506 RepID=A0A1I5CQH3_9BACT|nr:MULTISPECIES: metal-dependent transcriptional regulator [Algoriphagus]MAL11968.1 metal-dependent transcriptional regulator [Algoriphagus sp.]MAN87406.1 metal-dependent transcriptional regulator [Algoriphagus sp.]QYH38615.1 metal-dependent transcriptional regulator [Algoriphagus sp. NBT04N3]SFN89208.1 iron (metal) dependent repressor, DtxR family [Algoriphagus ornithinivorans]HAH36005.1 metal-dependent transcriptional regulator [Algoriphagus sp.]|tara:strand:- start:8866 stop:9528 length:663 start_codon:yes stop_codon:yes gene_type:complete